MPPHHVSMPARFAKLTVAHAARQVCGDTI